MGGEAVFIKATVVDMALPETGRIFAVSDIHGAGDLLKRALEQVKFGPEDTLFVLGDIVEKRAGGLAALRYVMDLKRRYRVHVICGNCDDLVPGFLDGRDELPPAFYDHYFRFFKDRSVLVEMGMSLGLTLEDCLDQPGLRAAIAEPFRAEMDFLRSLPTAIRTPEMLFVHGGVPSAQGIEELEAWRCMKNDNFLGQDNQLDRWCVVGHWPTTLYRPHIPCFNPIEDREKRVISIDGGTSIKEDGQLNLVELSRDGLVSWVGLDRLPTAVALDGQEESVCSVNIRWGRDNLLTVLERGEEFCRCRHLTTGREIDILTDYIWEKDGLTRCEDSTDYRLPVTAGETLSVVRRTSRGALVKKDGVTGWYTGRLAEPTSGLSS